MTQSAADLPTWMRPRRRTVDWGLLFVVAIGLLLNWPLAFWSGLPGNTDAALFVARAMEIADSLRSGTLYTRWAADFHFGYGSPLFNYLAPLPHYLSGLHQLITDANPIDSIKLWLAVSVIAAGVGMYHFARRRYGLRAGLVAAVVYMGAIPIAYALPVQSGSLAVLLSLALLPWTLWALDRLIDHPARAQWLIAIGVLVMWSLADTRLTLIGLPLLVVVLSGAWRKRRSRIAVWWVLSVATLLTAFFWLPALVERSDVRWIPLADDPLGGAISLTESLGTIPTIAAGILNSPAERGLGLGFTLTVIFGAAAFVRSTRAGRKATVARPELRWDVIAFGVIGCMAVVVSTPLLASQWMQLNGWQPIRPYDLLLGAALPALTIVAAQARGWAVPDIPAVGAVENQHNEVVRRRAIGTALVCMPILATLLPTLISSAWLPARSLDAPLSRDTETTINAIGTLRAGLLLPETAFQPDTSPAGIVFNSPQHDPARPFPGLLPISRTSLESRFTLSPLPIMQPLTLDRFAFPGWAVMVNNVDITPGVTSDGLLRIDVANRADKARDSEVLLTFGDTPIRYAAWLLTGLGVLLFVGRALLIPVAFLPDDRTSIVVDEWRRADAVMFGIVLALFALITITARLTPVFYAAAAPTNSAVATAATGTPTTTYPAALVGTTYDTRHYAPGASMMIVLFWRSLRPISADWQLVARLVPITPEFVAPSPVILTQWQPGNIPTSRWLTGWLIRDSLTIPIPADTVPGGYHVQVALAQCDSPQRLPCERPTPILPITNRPGAEWLTLRDEVQIEPR